MQSWSWEGKVRKRWEFKEPEKANYEVSCKVSCIMGPTASRFQVNWISTVCFPTMDGDDWAWRWRGIYHTKISWINWKFTLLSLTRHCVTFLILLSSASIIFRSFLHFQETRFLLILLVSFFAWDISFDSTFDYLDKILLIYLLRVM